MKVALLQYPIAWADKATNLRLTEERIAALAGKADVAVLPEMFATGFCTDHPELAETPDRYRAAVCKGGRRAALPFPDTLLRCAYPDYGFRNGS